ncbi:MAG: Crp/Fnr family transcriptional regulator [Rhodocyclales bacterium]|nr:Crp/Fnr family transcriptional regulator [Rhodocyclales bacterium]
MSVGQPTFWKFADRVCRILEGGGVAASDGHLTRQAGPTDFLARLSSADARDLIDAGQRKLFARNEFIFKAGDPGRHVYFLQQGRVKICQPAPEGKDVILWFCFTGDMFGMAEVARGGGRVVHAQACEASEVLVLSQNELTDYLKTHAAAALPIMQVLADRLRALGDVVVNLINDDAQTRIIKLILRLATRHGIRVGQDIHLNIHLTHQEIADMVGTTRQTASSVLGHLKRQGLMRLENRRIRIDSMELLDEMTNAT